MAQGAAWVRDPNMEGPHLQNGGVVACPPWAYRGAGRRAVPWIWGPSAKAPAALVLARPVLFIMGNLAANASAAEPDGGNR